MISFELSQDDPNYDAYVGGIEDIGQPIKYYVHQCELMKQDEKQTLSVDFRHLASFQFEDQFFMDKLLSEYSRYEPYLRKALTRFLVDHGY